MTGRTKKRDVIIEAGRARFRATGIETTTLEMIAEDVGLARPNFYRYFKSKGELVSAIIAHEVRVFNDERWRQTKPLRTSANRVVKSLQLGAQLVHDDPLWAALNSPAGVPYTAEATVQNPAVIEANREYWLRILEEARSKGELRADLGFEDIIRWMLGLEFLFVERRELFPDARTIGRYARKFVVPSILSRST